MMRDDRETATLTVIVRDSHLADGHEDRPGVILDAAAAGRVESLELLNASLGVEDPAGVDVAVEGQEKELV